MSERLGAFLHGTKSSIELGGMGNLGRKEVISTKMHAPGSHDGTSRKNKQKDRWPKSTHYVAPSGQALGHPNSSPVRLRCL